jgi:hypothetical protein
MRFPLVTAAFAAAAFAQTAPAPKLTGFPFQDESLRYRITIPGGAALGDATFSAHKGGPGWSFEVALNAGVPGFAVKDKYSSNATATDLCAVDFDRVYGHGSKASHEKTTFDQGNHRATRTTVLPANGGKTEMQVGSCAKDAVTFVYFFRREMGQGRVPPPETVYFGGGYSVSLKYTGEGKVKDAVVDHVVGSVKGPGSSFTVEIDFARDAARTPLLIKVPLAVGAVTAEIVR